METSLRKASNCIHKIFYKQGWKGEKMFRSTCAFVLSCLATGFVTSATAQQAKRATTPTEDDEIVAITFDNIPAGIKAISSAITLDGDVQANGELSATGSITSSNGTVCDSIGCIGDFLFPKRALLTYDVPSGEEGGPVLGSQVWITRELTGEIFDTADIVTLDTVTDRFTLEAGTYSIFATQIFFSENERIQSFRGRIMNVTDGDTVAISMTGRLHLLTSTSGNMEASIVPTIFTIDDTKDFELQYWIEVLGEPMDEDALGKRSGTGEDERYVAINIEKF